MPILQNPNGIQFPDDYPVGAGYTVLPKLPDLPVQLPAPPELTDDDRALIDAVRPLAFRPDLMIKTLHNLIRYYRPATYCPRRTNIVSDESNPTH